MTGESIPRGEEVEDEGLDVGEVSVVAAELVHVPPYLRFVSPLLGEVFPYVNFSLGDLQLRKKKIRSQNGPLNLDY